MGAILFFTILGLPVSEDLFVYNPDVSENIEYCTNISFNPNMVEKFKEHCDRDEVNEYIISVKNHR